MGKKKIGTLHPQCSNQIEALKEWYATEGALKEDTRGLIAFPWLYEYRKQPIKENNMSLRDEIEQFREGNGLIAPQPNPTHIDRTCDNGVMFFCEYYILLKRNGLLTIGDIQDFEGQLQRCMVKPGLVARVPGDTGYEAPDDYYALYAACVELECYELGKEVLNWGLSHEGSFNTHEPNLWTTDTFLWRQPQLYFANLCAANEVNVFHLPFALISSIIILFSCLRANPQDADSRRLAWLLVRATSPFSWLCRQASKIWFKRLYKTYPNGMKDVAKLYYNPSHPFIKYWVD